MIRILSLFLVIIYTSLFSYSQNSITTEMSDAKSLIEAYVSPLGYALGSTLNNGWYNTAKPHKLGGFDLTLTANIAFIPEDYDIFNITESNNGTFKGGNSATILGGLNNGGQANSSFGSNIPMPGGLNINFLPTPILQAGIGLIKNTEVNFRYMPDLEIKGVGTGLLGIGIKHDVLQWLPIVDKIPVDVSIQAGYTKLTSTFELNDPTNSINPTKANMDVTATTVNIVCSKKILMFTPYVGIGYNSTKTMFNVNGEYEIAGYEIGAKDLTSIEFENNNTLRANIGFRFQIAILALQANYTFSDYPIATLGVGISVR